jgi:hypothetical protein
MRTEYGTPSRTVQCPLLLSVVIKRVLIRCCVNNVHLAVLEAGTNFADKRRLLGWYSSLAD